MKVSMKRLIPALLAAVVLSSWSVASYADDCTCDGDGGDGGDGGGGGDGGKTNAGLGNGSEDGDPGNSGAHNQAGNAPAQPQSAAAQEDGQHEVDDADEPN